MNTDLKIGVIGGDLRQLVAASELANEGCEAAVYGFEDYNGPVGGVTRCVGVEDAVKGANFVILPVPYSLDKIHLNTPLSKSDIHLDDLFNLFKEGQVVIGGKFDKIAAGYAESAGIKLYDYYEREELTVLNAIPTAEGAINIAMQELRITLAGSRALVLGYGRIGKILSHKLSVLGVKVDVAARRNEDFAWIKVYGYNGIFYSELDSKLQDYDIIFNTVPAQVLDKKRLDNVKDKVVIIDLSSKPGGVDFSSAKDLNINVIWALSLPGKYAPHSSGIILKDTIKLIMKEEGIM